MNRPLEGLRQLLSKTEKTETRSASGQFDEGVDNTDAVGANPTSSGRFARFLDSFGHPRALSVVVVLTVLITLPTLMIGFYADDYSLISEIEHNVPGSPRPSPFDLYRFSTSRSELAHAIQDGPLPWFTDPSLKMHFFRPLTSVLFWLDHSLWGHFAVGYHITSILLYATLVFSVGLLLRTALTVRQSRFTTATPAFAALLFAIEAVHAEPAGWISSRHVMVAAIPAALALAAHVRFVREGWRPGAWLGPLGVIAALLGSETGLAAVACWLSFDALGPAPAERSSARDRLLASVPALVIGTAYLGIYRFFGFGAGGGAYDDPLSDPLGFLNVAAQKVPTLVGFSLTGVIASTSPIVGVVVGFAAAILLYALYRLARPAIPNEERVALRWLLPGAVLSLVIASAGDLSPRLLLFPSIGTASLLAVLIYRGGQQLAGGGRQLTLRVSRWPVVALHLFLAPLAFLLAVFQMTAAARLEREVFFTAEFDHASRSHVMILAAPDVQTAFYPAAVGQVVAPQAISAWQILSMANADHRFTRTGAASFRLDVIGGAATHNPVEDTFRSPRTPIRVGDSVKLTGATVTVLKVDGLEPTSLDVTVDVPLDNSTLALLMWRNGRLVRLLPPPVGASVQIPWSH